MKSVKMILLTSGMITISAGNLLQAQVTDVQKKERFVQMSERSEKEGLAEPFKGITTNGEVIPGLFEIRSTGVSTDHVRNAAMEFLNQLDPDQRRKTKFAVDDPEWRKWMNQHFYMRQGVGFFEMSENQRTAAFDLIKTSLSAKGLKLTRDIMKLNHTLAELNNNNFQEYGEWLYYITIMGEPSATEPWGWQMDGHHIIINYFVLGDQVVMTPLFVGSEPVIAKSGKYSGTMILQDEQDAGLKMLLALDQSQKEAAIIQTLKEGNNNLTEAFRDNVVLDYAGAKASSFSASQKDQLLSLMKMYVDNMDEGHAKTRMDELTAHIDETYFAWIGGTDDQSPYYYRIQSPVILIEFDHQRLVGIRHLHPEDKGPNRQHIHVVVRTPNGNDYGKELLRQHYQTHPHDH